MNEGGGLLLSKDLTEYQNLVEAFNLPSLRERFDLLRQMGNLFTVPPQNLSGIMDSGLLARFDKQALMKLVELRADYGNNPSKIGKLFGFL